MSWPFRKSTQPAGAAKEQPKAPYRVTALVDGGYRLNRLTWRYHGGLRPFPLYEPMSDLVFSTVEAAQNHLALYLERAAKSADLNSAAAFVERAK